MKRTILIIAILMITAPLVAGAWEKPDLAHSPKLVRLKGTWFLRGPEKCIEIVLDRKGRSEKLLGNREVYVDRNPDYLYMTIKRFPNTYTYRMQPIEYGWSYALQLVATGPEQEPNGSWNNNAYFSERFTGAFRRMVDCQMDALSVIEGGDSRTQPIEEMPADS